MFSRKLLICILLLVFAGIPGSLVGQEWARKMFASRKVDFGTVAAGSETVHEFVFQNIYEEDVHIKSVRSSCGCATVSIQKEHLKTWEKGAIVAKFNTDRFRGQRSATVTVVIDKPFRAEVQLQVKGNIRGDIVFSPGSVAFDEVKSSTPKTRKIRITKYGNSSWRIQDVRSRYTHVAVHLTELHRSRESVTYDMTITTKATAPEGYIQSELLIVTNDRGNQQVPISMTGRVVAPLQVSPSIVSFGSLKLGESGTKRILLKADKPFTISGISCEDQTVRSKPIRTGARKLHFVEVSYTANSQTGEFRRHLEIQTDLCKKPIRVPVVAEINN